MRKRILRPSNFGRAKRGVTRPGYLLGFGAFGQSADRAGPNKQGGLTSKYSDDLVFNPDEYDIIYNVKFGIGRPTGLPQGYVPPSEVGLPAKVATWIWNPKNGPAPWPGTGNPTPNAATSSKNTGSVASAPQQTVSPSIPVSYNSNPAVNNLINTINTTTGANIPDPRNNPLLNPNYNQPQAQPQNSSSTILIGIVGLLLMIAVPVFLLRRKKTAA